MHVKCCAWHDEGFTQGAHGIVYQYLAPMYHTTRARWEDFYLCAVLRRGLCLASFPRALKSKQVSSQQNFSYLAAPPPHSFTEYQIVPYTLEQIFSVIAGVEKYPEFIPWCLDSAIADKNSETRQDNLGMTDFLCVLTPQVTKMKCRLTVGFNLYKEAYTSLLTINKSSKKAQIIAESSSKDGIFENMTCKFTFHPGKENAFFHLLNFA